MSTTTGEDKWNSTLQEMNHKALLVACAQLARTADFETMVFTDDQRVTVDYEKLLTFLVALHEVEKLHVGACFEMHMML